MERAVQMVANMDARAREILNGLKQAAFGIIADSSAGLSRHLTGCTPP